MDKAIESQKLDQIFKQKKFTYKGKEYKLDLVATKSHPTYNALEKVPMNKLVGIDANGVKVEVWSHDCEVVKKKTKKK